MTTPTTSTSADAGLLLTFIDPVQLQKDLFVDVQNISASMANQTQLFVHYAMCAVRAKRQWDRWKTALEVLEAQLDKHYRTVMREDDAADAGDEAPKKGRSRAKASATEPAIAAAIRNDPKWRAASSRVIDAQEIYRLCDAAERAFEHRREMVKKIAEDQMAERNGQLRVNRNQDAVSARDELLQKMQERSAGAAAASAGR